jgi:PleD family two-component response regulator
MTRQVSKRPCDGCSSSDIQLHYQGSAHDAVEAAERLRPTVILQDLVMRAVGRESDAAGRLGGEEFAMLLQILQRADAAVYDAKHGGRDGWRLR